LLQLAEIVFTCIIVYDYTDIIVVVLLTRLASVIEIKSFEENFVCGVELVRNGKYGFNNYQSCRLSKNFFTCFCQSGFNWNSGKGDTTGAHELDDVHRFDVY